MQRILSMRLLGAIRRLVRACRNDERTLRFEGDFVRSRERRALLGEIAAERADFVRALEELEPPAGAHRPEGSPFAAVGRVGRAMRGHLGVRTDGDAVAHCRGSLGRTAALYERVLALPGIDPRMLSLLNDQHARVADEHRQLAYAQF